MTPRERAEKILDASCCTRPGYNDVTFLELVESQIREAVAAELADHAKINEGLWKIKMAQAYQDAAMVVEQFNLPDGNEFYWYKQQEAAAKTIRARAKEVLEGLTITH